MQLAGTQTEHQFSFVRDSNRRPYQNDIFWILLNTVVTSLKIIILLYRLGINRIFEFSSATAATVWPQPQQYCCQNNILPPLTFKSITYQLRPMSNGTSRWSFPLAEFARARTVGKQMAATSSRTASGC